MYSWCRSPIQDKPGNRCECTCPKKLGHIQEGRWLERTFQRLFCRLSQSWDRASLKQKRAEWLNLGTYRRLTATKKAQPSPIWASWWLFLNSLSIFNVRVWGGIVHSRSEVVGLWISAKELAIYQNLPICFPQQNFCTRVENYRKKFKSMLMLFDLNPIII